LREDKLKRLMTDALTDFFKSEAGETLIGTIMLKAIAQGLTREVRFEDGKTEPGRVVEKTESWNMVDWLIKYLPHIEAAIRGCQADSSQARNRSAEALDASHMTAKMIHMLGEAVKIAFEQHNPMQACNVMIDVNTELSKVLVAPDGQHKMEIGG